MKQDVASSFSFIQTMMALRVRELPVGHWLYELKFDGYRAPAFKAGKEARLVSRNQINFGNDYPQLIEALKLLTAKNVVIDACLVPSCRLEQKHTLNSKPLSFLCMGNRQARRASGSGDERYLAEAGIHCGADNLDKLWRRQREEFAESASGEQRTGAIRA
jgi:hypothetical protein